MSIATSYCHATHGRTHHLKTLVEGPTFGNRPFQISTPDARPDPTIQLPIPSISHRQIDDVGVLVGVGTTRLPLRRSECATIMWDFFYLPPTGVSAPEVVRASRDSADASEKFASESYAVCARDTLGHYSEPDFGKKYQFKEDYHRVLTWIAHADVQRALHAISWLYVELCWQYEPRPVDLDYNNWIIELQTKRDHKWIDRLDEQFLRACYVYREAEQCRKEGQTVRSVWYYLRTLFDMAPWFPTEAYLSTWEVKLPEIQIFFKCCLELSKALRKLNHHALSHAFVRILWQNRLCPIDIRISAITYLCLALDSPEYSSRPGFIDDSHFRALQRRMRLIPKKDWCFTEDLIGARAKEHFVHVISFARQFTVFDFLSHDLIWRNTSDGEERPLTLSRFDQWRLERWVRASPQEIPGLVYINLNDLVEKVEEGPGRSVGDPAEQRVVALAVSY